MDVFSEASQRLVRLVFISLNRTNCKVGKSQKSKEFLKQDQLHVGVEEWPAQRCGPSGHRHYELMGMSTTPDDISGAFVIVNSSHTMVDLEFMHTIAKLAKRRIL